MSARTIKIDGKEIQLKATGATPVFFQELFKQDMLKLLGGATTAESSEDIPFDILGKMCFVMALQGAGASFNEFENVTDRDFVIWLDQWSFSGLIGATQEILEAFLASNAPAAELKKTETKKE